MIVHLQKLDYHGPIKVCNNSRRELFLKSTPELFLKTRYELNPLPIYIAGPYSRSSDAEALAQFIQVSSQTHFAKAVIVSRWHRSIAGASMAEAHFTNMLDLKKASLMIALTYPDLGRETFVEIGIHLHRKRRIIWQPRQGGGAHCLSLEMNPLVEKISEVDSDLWAKLKPWLA